ncbi:MAG: apolipoprotein N-acyltransferase, partial [Candidatus Omnitrophica bacterium]|nr:apolipoprotein N-acyltransferase [Candidatus Omnitrophota bacterium]
MKVRFIKEIFLCILSAILLILSFPRFDFGVLSWIAFIPLFFSLQNKKPVIRFLLAYLMGMLFFFGTIYWLIHVTLAGMIVLVLYLAVYFGLFGLITSSSHIFFLPAAWVLLEYLRSHLLTGFGWVLLGHSQYLNPAIIQIADITGSYGVSFLIMLVNVSIFFGMKGKVRPLIVSFICLALTLGYGYFKLNQKREGEKIRIAVIQSNIPQELKWREEEKEKILDKHIDLSLASRRDKPELIIWPETALPLVLKFNPYILGSIKAFAQAIKTPLLLGTLRYENKNYYNSAVLFSDRGYIVQYYDKLHLVPFGEYIPLRKYLRFLETIVP